MFWKPRSQNFDAQRLILSDCSIFCVYEMKESDYAMMLITIYGVESWIENKQKGKIKELQLGLNI